jgi:hypothetical protein
MGENSISSSFLCTQLSNELRELRGLAQDGGGGGEQINITFYDGIKFLPRVSRDAENIYLFSLKQPTSKRETMLMSGAEMEMEKERERARWMDSMPYNGSSKLIKRRSHLGSGAIILN